jgi:tRNA-2-methylthio-N6-dimethylallyladenosine synthase
VPVIAIAGDFIVGFPGETEEDFAATVELVEKARYKNSFIFKYSPLLVTPMPNMEPSEFADIYHSFRTL